MWLHATIQTIVSNYTQFKVRDAMTEDKGQAVRQENVLVKHSLVLARTLVIALTWSTIIPKVDISKIFLYCTMYNNNVRAIPTYRVYRLHDNTHNIDRLGCVVR